MSDEKLSEEEEAGVKAIIALQGYMDIDESKEKALSGWRAFSDIEKKITMDTYRMIFKAQA